MNNKNRYMPVLMAMCVVIGIVLGTLFANHFSGNRLNIVKSGSSRLSNLLGIIEDQYVDEVNIDSLVEKAIPQILSELDPHSVYISAKDVQIANDDLKGSFSGVGIEFVIREDTLHVQNVINNGPAERAGLLAGDKIVKANPSLADPSFASLRTTIIQEIQDMPFSPEYYPEFLAKRCNFPISDPESAVAEWSDIVKCTEEPAFQLEPGMQCVGGLDYTKTNDFCGCILTFRKNGKIVNLHHSFICAKSKDLPAITREADILVAAVGRPKFVTADMVKPGATVIDVGINRIAPKKLVGDVDFDAVQDVAGAITPVPGGVGLLTVAMLMENVVTAAELQLSK